MTEILVLAKAYPPVIGGVETYSEEVVRAYLSIGIRVTVVTQTAGAKGWSQRHYREGNIALYNTGPGGQALTFLRFLSVLRRLILQQPFDMVHATTWRPAVALWPWRRRVQAAITVHGREVLNYPFFLKQPMIKTLARAEKVVAVSAATMEIAQAALFGRQPAGVWQVAFNGISHGAAARSMPHVARSDGQPIRLLTLARHVRRKNIDSCIRALATLRDEGLRFDYRIGGTGPMQSELKALARDLGLDQRVHFLGYVPDSDLPDLYANSDLFLHPQTNVGDGNDFEGFGLVLADAMSFGCAVLAGVAGGPRDFIRHLETGYLVDGLDQQAVTGGIRDLLSNPALLARIAAAGRKQALEDLSWDRHIAAVLDGMGARTAGAGGGTP